MKFYAAFFILCHSLAFAAPGILISGFDPFDKATKNNSQTLGTLLVERLQAIRPDLEIKYCQLRTVYDKSYESLIDCVHSMKEQPKFVISLGEANCRLRIETFASNKDYDTSHDNDGIHRRGTNIIPEGPDRTGFNLPLHKAWCKLSPSYKKKVAISTKTGTFVCNNLAYLMKEKSPEIRFSFMHVPAHNCLRPDTTKNVRIMSDLVLNMYESEINSFQSHPTMKYQVRKILKSADSCDEDFYSKMLKAF